MSQFQLIYNTESSKINLPINDSQVRLFRRVGVSRNAQDPTAAYVAMHDDGYEEPIGGGAGGSFLVESGTFNINSTTAASGTVVVSTTLTARRVDFNANGGGPNASIGVDDGVNPSCVSFAPTGADTSVQSNSIEFATAGNGVTAKITSITASDFTVTWTRVGAGIASIAVVWVAIER